MRPRMDEAHAYEKIRHPPGSGAALHRTRLWRRAARQSLSADDREGSAADARNGMGVRLPLFRHRAALRARPFRDPAQRIPAAEAAQLLPDLDQGRPIAGALQTEGALAAGRRRRFLRDALATRALRLFLRRSEAFARILARASRARRDRHRLRPRRRRVHPWQQGGRRRPHRGIHGRRLSRARRIARIGRDQGDRRRNQRMGNRRESGARRRFRPVSSRRTLHAARAGRADQLPAAMRRKRTSASSSADRSTRASSRPG